MNREEKRNHLAAANATQKRTAESIGLSARSSWRSWRRHPFSNARWWFWHHIPHTPKWGMEEWTWGSAGFENRVDAEGGGVYDRCKRCGLQKNERRYA